MEGGPPAWFDTALYGQALATFSLGLARTTGMLAITPFLGRGLLTGLARNAVIISLSLPVLPVVFLGRPEEAAAGGLLLLLGLLVKELFVGMVLGLPIAALSWGIEAAGGMIDNQRGSTMASSLNPATGNQTSPLGILLGQVYVTWMFVAGGFLALLDGLYASHLLWPAWSFVPRLDPGFAPAMLGLLDAIMRAALVLAGPALMAMFLAEFGLALVSRFAPNLQVFFIAMPIKSAVGLLMLILSLGVIMSEIRRESPSGQALLERAGEWLR